MSDLPSWKTIERTERDRLVADCCALGLSAQRIADRFSDCSRNAVLADTRRLGLKLKGGASSKRSRPTEQKAAAVISAKESRKRGAPGGIPSRSLKEARDAKLNINSSNILNKAESRKRDPGLPVVITASAAWDPLPGVEPIALDQLSSHTCRWPLWDAIDDPRVFAAQTPMSSRFIAAPIVAFPTSPPPSVNAPAYGQQKGFRDGQDP